MKILLISQYFYPENFKINDLIFSLKERGHEITVLTGKPNYSKTHFFDGYGWKSDDFETINDIPVYRANLFSRRNGGAFRLFLNYISFAFLASLKVRKIEGMGLGDAKLFFLIGAWFGYQSIFYILFFSSLVGSLIGIFIILKYKKKAQYQLPYGCFIVLTAYTYPLLGTYFFNLI